MSHIELSFEFFPPRTPAGMDKLRATCTQLAVLRPSFVSVTFGAGGSTQQGTLDTVLEIAQNGLKAAPHLSCIGAARENVRAILARYRAHNIRHIIALRGDLPSGMGEIGAFQYASELVEFIRTEHSDWFHIEVAAYPEYHPQAHSPSHDLENFARKIKAGANAAITQYFYNADAYFRFVDDVRRRGIKVPITPGIMPITNFSQLMRFSSMCGAEIPRWIARRLESFSDDKASIRAFGIDVVASLCERLLNGGAPGLHFYTLNGAVATYAICRQIALIDR
ncbi:methylenetetrahydrofolate reductase [NAD(P)H] [Mycoavidus sp. B2-EB]|uniref:methylenetetrahydrofolate reductase [NAD(P)H] n=1 Tax=Mycoavidus sp. B2-EB TaxID=2651972 RepID=UPI00162548CC|nr:methylenetetrahydrofolate reductase [NAD(P)H] [Mycoavidus sp. B2-EB]BBO58963.1 methylenetetrahydrofolate reductase [Mycoavidus sp. B2-EB]